MTMPPKMSAAGLFWWGAGLLIGGLLANALLPTALTGYSSETQANMFILFGRYIGALITVAHLLGVTLIAAGLTVKALRTESESADRHEP